MTTKVLVTGAGGILGQALVRCCPSDVELLPQSRAELDVTRRTDVLEALAALKPEAVIHGGAMTKVDACEEEQDHAYRVNWLGTRNIAEACAAVGSTPVVLSTDYVFDGQKSAPYREYDTTGPASVYGRSKWLGEEATRNLCPRSFVVRTQWVFGEGGPNFVDTMRRLATEHAVLKVVDDQHGCPTYTGDLAAALFRLLREDPGPGTYHLSAQGATTWCGFAREIFRQLGLDTTVEACTTAEFPRPAPRPAYGVLDNYHARLTFGDPMPPWEEGLRRYLTGDAATSKGVT